MQYPVLSLNRATNMCLNTVQVLYVVQDDKLE